MKKAWKIISTVLSWAVIATAVLMMIFTIVSVNTFNRNDRDIFGFHCYIVLSDSMSATDFDAGDLVLVKEVDPTTLQVGDIISYQSQNSENYGATVTHKIREKTTDANGNPGFITYGTTTGIDDETVVTYPFILGKYQMALPKVGTFFQFLKTPQGYIVCILIPFLLLIIYQGLNCVKIFKMYKAEQMAELQAEKDALEAQRKQSEAMMAQLLAMQQQMAAQSQQAAPPAGTVMQPVVVAQSQPAAAPVEAAAQPVVVAQTQPAPAPVEAAVQPVAVAQSQPAAAPVEAAAQPVAVAQTQPAAAPVEAAAQPDIAAMMAELQALRDQLASQNLFAASEAPQQPQVEENMQENGHGKENEA